MTQLRNTNPVIHFAATISNKLQHHWAHASTARAHENLGPKAQHCPRIICFHCLNSSTLFPKYIPQALGRKKKGS